MPKIKKFLSASRYPLAANSGFTIIELLMALGILIILIAFLLAALNPISQIKKGRDSKRKSHLAKVQDVLEDYYNDQGHYPSSLSFGSDFSPYLSKLPLDPQNEIPYIYYYATDGSGRPPWYRIFARMEYESDPVIQEVGCALGCGPDGNFNYWVASPNVHLAMMPGEVWPSIPPGGITSTPTSPPPPSTPTATPALTQTPTPTPTPRPWWNSSWAKRRKIEFDNSAQSENLTSFPVLIRLNSSRIDYGSTQDAGQDIRFVDDNDTDLLYHEIEIWNESGDSYAWVRVPQINGSSSSDFIWMYYDNPSTSAPDSTWAENAWDANFTLVQHLQETSGTHYDSTFRHNDGVPGNGVNQNASGRIAGADDFDGSNDYVNIAADPSLNLDSGGTIEAWIYPRSEGENNYGRLVDKSTDIYGTNGYCFQMGETTRVLAQLVEGGYVYSSDNSTPFNQWVYTAWTFNGSYWRIYVNGSLDTTASSSTLPPSVSIDVRIGNRTGVTDRTFDGRIDEVRLSNLPRSDDWIAAQYDSMIDSFATYGSEEVY